MKETKPLLTDTDQVLMYGDRVKFHWVDEEYYENIEVQFNWEGYLEGLYAGPLKNNPKVAVVTVVTPGDYRGRVLYPYITDLKRVDHPDPMYTNVETKKPELDMPEEYPGRKFDIESLKEMRDNIMQEFDFEKIHRVMEALEWGWAVSGDFTTRVPETSEIRREAKRLMDEVIKQYAETGETWCGVATGGFDVELMVNKDDGLPDLTLRFVVEEWNEGGEFWDDYERSFEERNNEPNWIDITDNPRKRKYFNGED